MNKIKLIKKFDNGFTILELIVSMSVLLLVLGLSVSIFISVVLGQKRMLENQNLSGQLSYVLEYMGKGLRMASRELTGECFGEDYVGYNYILTRYDSEQGFFTGVKFINESDNQACQEIYLHKDNSDPQNPISIIKEIKNNSEPISLTSEKLYINHFNFIINGEREVFGSLETDNIQPRITISINGSLSKDKDKSAVVQTTISQRNLNIR